MQLAAIIVIMVTARVFDALNGITYLVDCNLGKKQQKAYLPEGFQAVYLSKNSICHELSLYEARIWCKKKEVLEKGKKNVKTENWFGLG